MVELASGIGRVGLGVKILRVGGGSTVVSLEEVRLRLGGVVFCRDGWYHIKLGLGREVWTPAF